MFWLGVAIAYLLIVAVGLALGQVLGHRWPRPPGTPEAPAAPTGPRGPSHAILPPLGTPFDRELLPAVDFDAAGITTGRG